MKYAWLAEEAASVGKVMAASAVQGRAGGGEMWRQRQRGLPVLNGGRREVGWNGVAGRHEQSGKAAGGGGRAKRSEALSLLSSKNGGWRRRRSGEAGGQKRWGGARGVAEPRGEG